jgi:hypothetical protein
LLRAAITLTKRAGGAIGLWDARIDERLRWIDVLETRNTMTVMRRQTMKYHLVLCLAAASMLFAQAPDNTKMNERDRQGGSTADDQKMNKTDRELAQKIRRSVYDDKTLSTYAHNVKIIVADGRVTLKGPVRSQEEKDAVEKRATAVAGATNVVNQMDVVPDKH